MPASVSITSVSNNGTISVNGTVSGLFSDGNNFNAEAAGALAVVTTVTVTYQRTDVAANPVQFSTNLTGNGAWTVTHSNLAANATYTLTPKAFTNGTLVATGVPVTGVKT